MRIVSRFCLTVGIVSIAAVACNSSEPARPEISVVTKLTPVERGEYLVEAMACGDCHTPWKMGAGGQPEPDTTRLLSGHPADMPLGKPPKMDGGWMMAAAGTNTAWAGPWGVSYTANLTPDRNSGIGIWTEDMFIKSIREGKHMGTSRPVLPPMPWQSFRNLKDEDLKAIFAYLKSIPAIANHVPDPLTPDDVAKMK